MDTHRNTDKYCKLNELYSLDIMAKGNLNDIEERLKKLLHDIYFR